MKAIKEMSAEELREALVVAQSQLSEALLRAEKAEKDIESYKGAWQYQADEIDSYKAKISSLKTLVGLL